jgi:PAS domain S-box-containing protein
MVPRGIIMGGPYMEIRNESDSERRNPSTVLPKTSGKPGSPSVQSNLFERYEPYGESSFHKMFDESLFGVAIVDQDHQVIHANRTLCRMLGYSENQLKEIRLLDIVHPEDVLRESELAESFFKGEFSNYTIELRFLNSNGTVLWANTKTSVLRDTRGKIVYGLYIVEDIANRKLAEAEHKKTGDQLQECTTDAILKQVKANEALLMKIAEVTQIEKALSEGAERLRSIVETAYDPIIGADSSGNIMMWNSSAARTFGYSFEEVLNKPLTILMPERFAKLHENAMHRAVDAGGLYYAKRVREVYGRRKDGSEFPLEVSISAWKTNDGMFFTGIIRDITDRKQKDEELRKANEELEHRVMERTAELIKLNENLKQEITERKRVEEMLRDSERLYHTLVEEVPDVIFLLDDEGRFTYLNTQAEEFLRRPLKELLDTSLASYVIPEETEKIEAIFRLARDSIWDEEIRLLDADGEKKFARIRCKALEREGQERVQYEGVMRDITRRRRLEEQLKESREQLLEKIRIIDDLYAHIVESGKAKAIAEHTTEVAHELRQPLTIIGGFARRIARQLDADNIKNDAGQVAGVHIITSEIQRLEKILNTLIDFTKRESIMQKMAAPDALIEKILKLYEQVAIEKKLKWDVKFSEEVGEIMLDPERFEEVLRNLISNAIESSPVGGTVHIETGISSPSSRALEQASLESENYFEMKIRNHGPVIKAQDLQRIFSPFFTTKNYGTGIGLTVSKKIVEAHNGSISVHSDSEGTTFTVWLPVHESESTSKQPSLKSCSAC